MPNQVTSIIIFFTIIINFNDRTFNKLGLFVIFLSNKKAHQCSQNNFLVIITFGNLETTECGLVQCSLVLPSVA